MRFEWQRYKASRADAVVTLAAAANPNPGSTMPSWLNTTSIVITFGSVAVAERFMSDADPTGAPHTVRIER